MYIINVLSVATSEIEQSKPFNDQLDAQNYFMDKIEELSKSEDEYVQYSATFVSRSKVLIIKCEIGRIYNSKRVHKYIEMKFDPDHEV